ncbi:MAG TPA: NAD(P)-dependent oxidoreductase [Bacteroidales bacterium]|nr:NAD(P)-dependent oxidoreductase [Bacteroidales bacterium]
MKIVFVESLGVSEELLKKAKSHFESQAHEFVYFLDRKDSAEEIINRAKDADILTLSNISVGKEIIENCPQLKLINVAFTGTDHIDTSLCRKEGINVSNAAGYSTVAVSEMALGLAISLLRNIPAMDAKTRIPADRVGFLGMELNSKTVGIVGTGAIGMATAKLFAAFGCKIIAWSRTMKNIDFISYVGLDELFESSDIISLHIPANAETKNLVNAKMLSKMKSSAVIINTARGQVVDYQALADLLKDKKIAGAGIDIYETEPPLPDNHPLLSAPNTVLVPHIAYATKEAMLKRFDIAISNIDWFLKGEIKNKIV